MARRGTSNSRNRNVRKCAGCGKPIQSGLYCDQCLEKLREQAKVQGRRLEMMKRNDLKRVAENKNEIFVLVSISDERNLNITKIILERGLPEYKILAVSNPLNTINMLVSHEVNVVILDADYNGLDMLRRLREDERFKNLPVMMMSGSTERELVANVFSLGVQDYVTKPCLPKDLVDRVIKLLHGDPVKKSAPPVNETRSKATFRILLIDDDIFDMRQERQLLQNRLPCEIIAAQSAAEGMRILENRGADLVLVSLDMPFINGLKFIALMQNNARLNNIPVIILTETRDFAVISEIDRSAAAGYVKKPNIGEDGIALIERTLRNRK